METQPSQSRRGTTAAADDAASTPRRRFLGALTAAVGGTLAVAATPLRATATPNRLHLQDCRIAGSQYYACDTVLPRLHVGDTLRLRREPNNPYDPRAVAVFWRDHKLGYLPRLDNAAAASLADRAHSLHAEIIGIDDPDKQWEPVRLRVWVATA